MWCCSCWCVNFFTSFLHQSEKWLLKVSLLSNLTPHSFSQWLFFISKVSTLILTVLFVLTNKWHLSELLFITLSLNHLNNLVEVSSTVLTTPVYNKFIITVPTGKVLLKSEHKFFLKPQDSNTTNIAEDILIISTEHMHKI